jgi:hypothetical protein
MSPFSVPFFWDTQKREAASNRAHFGRGTRNLRGVLEDFLGGDGKAEGAKVPGAGIWPEQCPGKCATEKGWLTELRHDGRSRAKQAARIALRVYRD